MRWLPGEVLDLIHFGSLVHLQRDYNALVQPFSYTGFHKHLMNLLDTARHTRPLGGYHGDALIPATVTVVKERVEWLLSSKLSDEEDADSHALSKTQKAWLLRLYEQLMLVPEVIWLNPAFEKSQQEAADAERDEILARWGSATQTAQLPSDRTGSDAASALRLAISNLKDQMDGRLDLHTFCIAATPICFLDMAGRPRDSKIPLPSSFPVDQYILPARLLKLPQSSTFTNAPEHPAPVDAFRQVTVLDPALQKHSVHSLFSMCLRSASSVPELQQLPDLLPDDVAPTVRTGLETAVQVHQEGGRICSTCKRKYIVPRAEWLEYHFIRSRWRNDQESHEPFVPFLRRVCSWACVPHLEFED